MLKISIRLMGYEFLGFEYSKDKEEKKDGKDNIIR